MRQLLYVSNPTSELTPSALDKILTASRANNALLGVTGLLLHIDGGFLQMLEGEEIAVRTLYTRIAADRRQDLPAAAGEHASSPFNGERLEQDAC